MLAKGNYKFCSRCHFEKALAAFNKNKSAKDGLQNYCRECMKKSETKYRATRGEYRSKLSRERYASEEGYRQHLNRYFKYTYKITLAEYEALVLSQKNKCAICFQSTADGSRLYVDHCHESKKSSRIALLSL